MAKKDYKAIAAKRITRPSETEFLPSFLIYGRNKKGKSTLAVSAGVEKTLFLDPEQGTKAMKKSNPHVWHITRWEDVSDAYGFLRLGEHDYEWVVLDGLTRIHNMALRFVMAQAEERDLERKPGMVQLQDHGKAGELTKGMLNNFHTLPGVGLIITAQERMVSVDTGDEETEDESVMFVPDLPKGVKGHVNSIVDMIGRIYTTEVNLRSGGTKTQRRLQIGVHERYDTGYRSDFDIPDMVKNPTIPKLVKLMEEGQ